MELNAAYPHPEGIDAWEAADWLAPFLGIADPADIGAYFVVAIDKQGIAHFTGTDNIPPGQYPEFLEWVARSMREVIREAN